MKKPLRVVSIDGNRGAGKSTQIKMLANYLKATGTKHIILDAGNTVANGVDSIAKANEFLSQNADSVVLLNGSIARMMVREINDGVPTDRVLSTYNQLIHSYEVLNHKYGIAGILIVMDDLEECRKRLFKRDSALAVDEPYESPDLSKEKDLVSGMRFFDNHVISKGLKFHTINIEPSDSIMGINKAIVEYLSEHYEIKKPLSDDNGW